jgi:hypothetical protein
MTREAGPAAQQLANMARIGLSPATAAAAATEPVVKPPLQPSSDMLQRFRDEAPKGEVLIDVQSDEMGGFAPIYGEKRSFGKGI